MTGALHPKRTEKLQIMIDDQELAAIDKWRFDNRFPTRASAIRELLRRGLEATADQPEPVATLGAKSADFGVIDQQGG